MLPLVASSAAKLLQDGQSGEILEHPVASLAWQLRPPSLGSPYKHDIAPGRFPCGTRPLVSAQALPDGLPQKPWAQCALSGRYRLGRMTTMQATRVGRLTREPEDPRLT